MKIVSKFCFKTIPIFRYPDYGPEINVNRTKYDEKETFVSFNNEFEIDEVPFKQIRIWHDLFKEGRSN